MQGFQGKIAGFHPGKYNPHMYDIRLLLYVLALGSIGILVIGSAADGYAKKQMIGFIGGFIFMIIF